MDGLSIRDYEHIINEVGQAYVQVRKECLIECNNLLDTHEITLAEKNCLNNCFRKMNHAFQHFNKMSIRNIDKINNLSESQFNTKY